MQMKTVKHICRASVNNIYDKTAFSYISDFPVVVAIQIFVCFVSFGTQLEKRWSVLDNLWTQRSSRVPLPSEKGSDLESFKDMRNSEREREREICKQYNI